MEMTHPLPISLPKLSLSQKLMIIQQLIAQLGPNTNLKVVITDDPMNPTNYQQQNHIHNYQLLGSKSLRKTQNNNLLQKLQVFQRQPFIPCQPNQIQQQPHNQKTMFRYFSQNIKCFRCKKLGHYDYACLDQFKCNYCLSSLHHTDKCTQKTVCFKCYQYGHVINQCKQKQQGQFCQNCRRKHHHKCGFLMKGAQNLKQMFTMDHLYMSDEIQCLKCFQYGHFNCQKSQGSQTYYKRSYTVGNDRNDTKNNSQDRYYNQNGNKKQKY